MNMDKSKFNFVIGFKWDDEINGPIGTYTLHNQNVFHGTIDDAKSLLHKIEEMDKDSGFVYNIYKLVKVKD